MIETWGQITLSALQEALQGFLNFLPNLIAAIIVFVIGWFISVGIGKLITRILNSFRINQFFEKRGWKESLAKVDIKMDISGLIGALIKWFLVIIFLSAAANILKLEQFSSFLTKVVAWIPNLIIAALIFVVAVIVADLLEKIIKGFAKTIGTGYVKTLGAVVRWAIWIFAIFAILVQLGIAPTIINTIIIGLVGMLALAGGLAFGLGAKDEAGNLIRQIREKISEHGER